MRLRIQFRIFNQDPICPHILDLTILEFDVLRHLYVSAHICFVNPSCVSLSKIRFNCLLYNLFGRKWWLKRTNFLCNASTYIKNGILSLIKTGND